MSFNPWSYKPWWCQPWSILLTAILLVSGSWLLAHTIWITLTISIPILVWAGYFIFVWPRLIRDSLEREGELKELQDI